VTVVPLGGRLGWRNVWRNPRRSLLSIAAVAVAFAVLIALDAIREGMARQLLDSGTRLLLGHLQVHDGAYLPDRGLYDTIGGDAGTDLPALLAAVEARPGVRAAAPRVYGFGLLSTGPRSVPGHLLPDHRLHRAQHAPDVGARAAAGVRAPGALGLPAWRRFALIVLEAALLGALAVGAGVALGWGAHTYFRLHGLPLAWFTRQQLEMAGVILEPVLYSTWSPCSRRRRTPSSCSCSAACAPQRIDREYKPGVDALRLTVPLSPLSEVELVAAGQGPSVERDGSVGVLGRFHLGPADAGAMLGRFHRDTVVGAFVTADAVGTGLRAEVGFTESGEPADARIGRARFGRAGLGLDRQLTPALALTAELAWNGFGVPDPARYPTIAAADRVQRGEVTALGRYFLGASLAWQAHPLVSVTATALVSLDDGSALLLPFADVSLADNLSLLVGAIVGLGPGPRADGRPASEYGGVPQTLYAALRAYF
jgi:hypothetical protein